jgi:hypothetical protein
MGCTGEKIATENEGMVDGLIGRIDMPRNGPHFLLLATWVRVSRYRDTIFFLRP